ENKGKKGKSKEKDDDHVTTATSDDLAILGDFESVNLVSDESMWIIDSGATLHVISRKKFFTSYTSGDFGVLKMGNDGWIKMIGVGDVCLQTNVGMKLWLRGVKHALDVCFNLISVHMLDDGGFDNHFGHGKWKLTKGNLVVIKDQVLEKFKQFQALVERQSSKKVKCIRTNNSGEYWGPFDVYCKQQTIKHEKTPPKTPRLNGLAERMNKTLIKRVLDKIWFGKDVKYDHLRVFGCKAFMHVPKDERSKLDMKTRQCIFIGYGHDEYGYRMYDLVKKKLVRSRDVQFMEDQSIEDLIRSKHIDVRYHWIRDALDTKMLQLTKVHIDNNGADMMTKTVPRGKFEACCEIVGLAITST
ncbi:hypothetical protein CR513_16925, partial [Mucuna pruriens]